MLPQIRCLITLRVERSIISINSNTINKLIRKFIKLWLEKCRSQNEIFRNCSINLIFLRRRIQNHSKPFIKGKWWNRSNIRPEIPEELKFAKRISMPNPVERLKHEMIYRTLYKFYQIQLSGDLQLIETTWNHTGNQKKSHISRGDQQFYYLQVFQRI